MRQRNTPKPMKQTVHAYIEQNKLLNPGGKVIVALSGGADSVALLHILLSLHYECVAAHCNFHLRGEESERDEQFVRSLCGEWRVPLHVRQFDTEAYARANRLSIEMAARDLRYAWFRELAAREQAQAVAVAHHADDQAETVLMNLVRGAGLRGMCGMPVRNGVVVRPLLCCTRKGIEDYLRTKQIPFVTDSTNTQTDYKRNKFRHIVLPMLEQINPGIRQTLAEERDHFAGYRQMAQAYMEQAAARLVHQTDGRLHIDTAGLLREPAPETVLYELLLPYGFNATQARQLHAALDGTPGKRFESPTHYAIKDRAEIIIGRRTDCEEAKPTIKTNVRNRRPTEIFPAADADVAFFDADKLRGPLSVRHWQAGDVFRPIGLKGKKKISDFFTDCKLDVQQKQAVWLVLSGTEVAWVAGHRIDERFKVGAGTTRVAEVRLVPSGGSPARPDTKPQANSKEA